MKEYSQEYIDNHPKEFFLKKDGQYCPYKKEDIYDSINIDDYNTILPICKLLNIPFIEEDWKRWKRSHSHLGSKIICRYHAQMKLLGYKGFTYEDTEWLNAKV